MLRLLKALAIVGVLVTTACRTAAPVEGMPVNFGVVAEGKIYRGGQPTAAQIENLHRLGIRTIVKVNTDEIEEERTAVAGPGIRLIEVPLNARRIGTSSSCADVERAYVEIVDPQNWPVYVHCQHGRDRTGFLIGLYRQRVEGWAFPQISEELSHYGHTTPLRIALPSISDALAARYPACSAYRE